MSLSKTSREIVLDTFKMKKTERIPVGVCLGGSWPFFIEGEPLEGLLHYPEKAARIFYEVNERVDADFITVGTGATALILEGMGAEISFPKDGAPSIESILAGSKSDIDRLDISRVFKTERVQWLKAVAEETIKLNRCRRALFVSGRAPFTLAGQLAGLESFTKSLYKDKQFVKRLLEFTLELSSSYYEFMLGADGLDGIFIADPSASGDVLSVRHFEEFAVPGLKSLGERLVQFKKPSLLHICGNITNRLHLLPHTGLDMISVDSKVDMRKAREILSGRMGLAGNVHPVFVLEDLSSSEVAEKTRQCIAVAEGVGFMLLPGCDLSSRTPEENVAAFVKTGHEWAA
ncbi:MAG: uroporphyrinogen decarboxylase family protein [Synergistaceae bacterium]|jgi:uroporphyrinogen decarboxylase|nr:uroporphyrinogen decarboxylase family protein [Synergistaceae bacterium]